MGEYETLTHTFEPVYNVESKILILGTFPSVKSRQQHFYYGHPQNRFWKVQEMCCPPRSKKRKHSCFGIILQSGT